MKKLVFPLILLSQLILFVSPAVSEDLTIMTLALNPYGYMEKGRETGLTYEVANAIAIEAGYSPHNHIAPLKRAVEDLVSGKADITIMFPLPEVEAVAFNLGVVMEMENIVLGRAGTFMRSFRELRGKTLATVRGARYDDRISKANGIIPYPTESYSQSLKMLMAGRVDGVVGPKLGLFHAAKKLRLPKKSFNTPFVLSVGKACVFLSKVTASPEKRARLLKAMDTISRNGTIELLLQKYSL